MSVRNLEFLFKPKSVALVGASKEPSSVGAVLANNLLSAGFDGPVMPVNPRQGSIGGVLAYPDVASLPVTPHLAVISTPPDSVPGIVAELGVRGTRAAVVITAGFGESAEAHGRELQQALLDAARPHLMRIVGPNCLGVMVPGVGLNASFSHVHPKPGRLAFVAQSGALMTSVLDWAHSRGIGFSYLVSLGGMADVDFGDMLDYLANDAETSAILLYIEAVAHARKFMSAARAAARMKPVLVVKVGRHAEGARAVASHTGALAGSDAVYEAVFRRAGMLRVFSLGELFDAVETLAMTRPPRGDRLAILTNGGGMGVIATDALMEQGGRLTGLSSETLTKLNDILPATWSHGNPVDIIGDAPPSRYADALRILREDKGVDAVLVLNCPLLAACSCTAAARAVLETVKGREDPPVLTSWVGNGSTHEARRMFAEHRIPTYDTPGRAVRGFMHLVRYRRRRETLMETPASVPEEFSPDIGRARAPVENALAGGRPWLTEIEAREVLVAYGIPVVETRIVNTPDEAATIAGEIGGPVALKIISADITHKTDVGGVALDIVGSTAVREAARAMMERGARVQPNASLTGFIVQPMVRRSGAYELIVGMMEDMQFGPVIVFGHGGTAVEVVNDKALGLPPLNMHLARELMRRTRIFGLLKGHRGLQGANLDAIALTLIKVAQLAIDVPEIAELDINPLLAHEGGVMALDARIRVAATTNGFDRLAIRPYPKELEEEVRLGDGRVLLLRPIRPEDEPSLHATFARLTPEEIRLRFFAPMKTLSHFMGARFTQLDYDREMALILTERGIAGKTEIFGMVGISADPDNERAEYAVLVPRDMTGMGLGVLLMRRIIDYARNRGIGEIFGEVLYENAPMLKLCRFFGFTQSRVPGDPSIVKVTLKLSA